MKNKEIEESIKRIKEIVDFYKLNDENNYDYSDDLLISMKNLLSYIEQLENKCESLLEDRRQLLNVVNILQNNRDKAIEYLEFIQMDKTDKYIPLRDYKEFGILMNILKGDSDEQR